MMVGTNLREDILTSCKATAMIYNDNQKKWLHCASNGPAKIQLLFSPDSQTYRIVGRQIQDHEVVLNHSISKGIKYNQATATFHQWRDQSSVYGLNFSSKIDAQEFGTTMMKILETVNSSSQILLNGGATLPPSSITQNNNINNNNNPPTYKRQSSQPPSSSSSTTDIQQYYSNPLRQNSLNNNNYGQHQQSIDDEETNYALISDSCTYFAENSSKIPPAPPLNIPITNVPPPPPPPPLPNGFNNPPPIAPSLNNGNTNLGTVRKSNPTTSAPPMDLMSEMAAKFAQRRKYLDENESTTNSNSPNKTTMKTTSSTVPPSSSSSSGPVSTSPRVTRKTSDSHYSSMDLEKLKNDLLNEIRKDIEKAKQDILNALLDSTQQHTKI